MTESVEKLRSVVAQLEQGIERKDSELAEYRAAFEKAVAGIADTERAIQTYKTTLAQARQELAEAEITEAAQERAAILDSGLASMMAEFLKRAQGKPWFVGTGNDDAILPHQWQGCQFGAVAERWILGDGVGLGKTRTAVGWLDLVEAKKVLVICEPNIANQFAGEISELAPHRTLINLYKKTPKKKHELLDSLSAMDEGIVVVNFEVWRRDHDIIAKLINWQLDTVIVDEAHNLKTTATSNFKLVKTIIAMDNTCAKCGGHIWGLYDTADIKKKVPKPCENCGWKVGDPLPIRRASKFDALMSTRSVKNLCFTTGTPILNDPLDLFSLLHLINPILFPTKAAFQREYLKTNHHSGHVEFREGAMTRLKPMLADILLARTLDDTGVVLPPQHVNVWPVGLDKEEYPLQYRTIRQITDAAQIVLDSGEEASIMSIMALITRKRQANVWPGGIEIKDTRPESPTYGEVLLRVGDEVQESVKMDEIKDHILKLRNEGDEQGRKHPVQLVFSQFKTGLAELEQRLTAAGLCVARFDGDTPANLRQEIKHNLNRSNRETPKWDVVLANYKTGGTGLNFTWVTATHIMDEEWNPGKRDQGYGRSHRLGQTEESLVFVYRIPGTIDIWMSNTIKRKENLIEGFNETMKEADLAESFKDAMASGTIL